MCDSPQDTYAKCLPTRYGYPLWNPEPSCTLPDEYQQDGLQIGDVGIVDPDCGFNVLFNIYKPHDHALHNRHGVPPSHSPVILNAEDVVVERNAIAPGSVIFSSGAQLQIPPSGALPNVAYEFIARSSEGAVLILPQGATFHNLRDKTLVCDLAIQNAAKWYRFATQCLEREISIGLLYLITGFYKAPCWSLAVYQNAPPAGGLIKVVKVGNSSSSESENFQWDSTLPIVWKSGPRHSRNGNANQAVFLRGHKIAMKGFISRLRYMIEEISLPAYSPQDVCVKSLPIHHECPLWNPTSSDTLPDEYQQDGLQIGDVCIINPDGVIDVFFNICKPHNHPLHKRYGTPQFHVPVRLHAEDVDVKSNAIRPGSVVYSLGVMRTIPSSDAPPNTAYEFTPRCSEGAILVFPRGATFHGIRSEHKFRDFAIQRAGNWYRFVTERLQRQISDDALHLITGFYKPPCWSFAAFQDASPVSGLIKAVKAEDGSDPGNFQWDSTFPIVWENWPKHDHDGNAIQSVFNIEGYRITLKEASALDVQISFVSFLKQSSHRKKTPEYAT